MTAKAAAREDALATDEEDDEVEFEADEVGVEGEVSLREPISFAVWIPCWPFLEVSAVFTSILEGVKMGLFCR